MSTKISEMTAAATVQPTDQVPVVRGGQNFRVPASAFGGTDNTTTFKLIAGGTKVDYSGTSPMSYSGWNVSRVSGSSDIVDNAANALLFKQDGMYELSFSANVSNYGLYGTPSPFATAIFAQLLLLGSGISEAVQGMSTYGVLRTGEGGASLNLETAGISQTLLISVFGATPGAPMRGAPSILLLPTGYDYNQGAVDARGFVVIRKLPALV